ncbi:MAG: helix-turn-helix transcriptional regulator [Clostridiales bacterium]|nr:helix-turn-helix transcriptional regulator [Clostridiales bacterium]
MDVIARIQELREERGWTNYQLAKKAGLSQSTISSAMNRANNVTVQTIQKCCDAFGITMVEFFDDGLRPKEFSMRERKLIEEWRKLPSEIKSATEMMISYSSRNDNDRESKSTSKSECWE